LPDPPGQAADSLADGKPHNAFGARLKAVKRELRKAGKPITIAARLEAVAGEDSDGDGVSNLIEILSGHFPGDPTDRPTAEEIAGAQRKLLEFREWQKQYAWLPFDKVRRPAVPAVKNAGWVRNPIDAFIAVEYERHGLEPRPEASRAVLLRRLYLDLIGLPPTPVELHALLADPAPDAYEKVVDRLLDSPQYGERWGRHWMDIWRYSDWAGWSGGGQIRDSQPHIWRWRDWIVESLNQDKGYDRMILEMLAGDELAPEDPATLRATGYLVRNYKMLSREKWMQDTVNHTSQAFLGITLGCARCHDHMYDPILQKEYYEVRAVFEPYNVRIDRLPGEPDIKKDGLARVYDANPAVPTFLFIRGDDRRPDKTPLPPGVPEVLGEKLAGIEPVKLPTGAWAPDKRDFVVREELKRLRNEIRQAERRFEPLCRSIYASFPGLLLQDPTAPGTHLDLLFPLFSLDDEGQDLKLAHARLAAFTAVVAAEQLEDEGKKGKPAWEAAARIAVRAQLEVIALEKQANKLLPGNATTKPDTGKALKPPQRPSGTNFIHRQCMTYPSTSTGRRLSFAHWIANRDNPLTARVAMNHIWLRHFGQAIVPTVFDFGRNGRPPSHPALLDWLAAEFMARNWSMKEMHRLIVTSSTYRMASTTDPANTALDRDNVYLWHMPSRRMEAEVVRDCVFFVSGKLDLAMGGPEIDQHQGMQVPRRSLYFRHAAEKQMGFLKIFDGPSVTECYQRKESVMPQQALALINSELTLKHARLLGDELSARVGSDDEAFIRHAFDRVLSRPPTNPEKLECLRFLTEQTQRYQQDSHKTATLAINDGRGPAADPCLRARESLVHVLMNHNDFVTIR
jgi:hypothetical protein